MKKIKYLTIILCIFMIIFLMPNIIKAETGDGTNTGTGTGTDTEPDDSLTWTDVERLRISINELLMGYKLEVTGITQVQSHQYYMFFTNDKVEPTITLDSDGKISSDNYLSDVYITDYIEKKDDIYLWICEQQKDEITNTYKQKFIVKAEEIKRPEQRKLGSRIYVALTSDDSTISINGPHSDNPRKVKLKVGKITDNSILLSIKNGEADSLNKLLSYAKTANSIYDDTIPVGKSETIIKNMELKHMDYYYIYSVLGTKDENGKDVYYPLEDISIVQANIVSNTGFKSLLTDLDWTGFQGQPSNPGTDKKPAGSNSDGSTADKKIPQTGENITVIVALFVLAGLGTTLYFKNRQYREIK